MLILFRSKRESARDRTRREPGTNVEVVRAMRAELSREFREESVGGVE